MPALARTVTSFASESGPDTTPYEAKGGGGGGSHLKKRQTPSLSLVISPEKENSEMGRERESPSRNQNMPPQNIPLWHENFFGAEDN